MKQKQKTIFYVYKVKEEVYRKLLASNLPSKPERFIIMKNEIDYEVREVNKNSAYVQYMLNS